MLKEGLPTASEKSEKRSLWIRFLEELTQVNPAERVVSWDKEGLLEKILPELVALKGVEQRPDYHLEGDVWTHTLATLQYLPQNASLDLKLAFLFHDIGKAKTSKTIKEVIHSFDHSQEGAKITCRILDRLGVSLPPFELNKEKIVWLVESHLVGQGSGGEVLREATIKNYFLRPDGWGDDLLNLIIADTWGREGKEGKIKTATLNATIARIEEIKAREAREPTPPPPIPNGKEIMEIFNLPPSPAVGQIKAALGRLCRNLGFTDEGAGKSVALSLRNFLHLKPGLREIPPKALEKAVRRTIRTFLKEGLPDQLGTTSILVLTNSEEDPIKSEEVSGEWRQFELQKGEARVLKNKQIRILFLGSPRSGKTSFVDSLSWYLQNLCHDLPFELTVQALDLDKSRSDLSVLQGITSPSQKRKIRWTGPLSREAKRDFKKQGSNLILGDGPGGPPDDITQIVARSANCAVLIVKGENDQIYDSTRNLYRQFLARESIPLVAEFRSRPKGQVKQEAKKGLIQSELRTFRSGEFIGGQIVGLQYGEENKDLVIEDTAKAFLFSILSALCQNRKRR